MIPVHPLSGESHKRDGLEQKDISMSGRLSRRYQLWCSKPRCPSNLCTTHCRADVRVDRNVKICQAPTFPAVDENVLGFDVTVDNSMVVQVRAAHPGARSALLAIWAVDRCQPTCRVIRAGVRASAQKL